MRNRLFAALALAGTFMTTGCATLFCDDYMDFGSILNSYKGRNLVEFERHYNVRPISTMVRPQNRTEYTYITRQADPGTGVTDCVARLVADNATGEVVTWSYEGQSCFWHEYCAS